jgi:two-component system, NtrC family, response regulator GlrR
MPAVPAVTRASEPPSLVRNSAETDVQHFGQMVGRSTAIATLFSLLKRAAASEATVLIEGETGTGKEASAEAIHRESRRRGGPFVVVDCGAIPPQLLESELFGYERGAFTGAVQARPGAFEAASGGTILLDEIGELSLDLQPKILRALERKQIKRIGSTAYVPADVRVLAATNRSLRTEVAQGRFRSDLYYRLAVLKILLPPLRDRAGDIPLLIENVLDRLGIADSPEASKLLSPEFVAKLASYRWSGNVRQLRNYLERCVALGDTTLPLTDTMLPPPPAAAAASNLSQGADAIPFETFTQPFKEARDAVVSAFERRYLETQLARHDNNVSAAARASRIDRIHFYRLMWKHGLRARDAEAPPKD